MKRSSKYIIALLITLLSVLAFSACNKVEFKVSFVVDGEVYHTIATSGDEIIKMPDNPTKDGYIFDGWYWDKDVWKKPFTADSLLHAPLSDNMTVYAKWRAEEELMGTEAAFGGDFKKTNEDEYSVVVPNSVSVFSLNNIVTVNLKSSWVLATDVFANDVIASRTVSLAPGDNTYYVLVTSEDENFKLYTIHIRRRPIFNVIFNTDGGTEVVTQDVEEGDLATEPSSISKIGYNFIEWDFDFSIPITSNKTIAAIWEIKTYSVTFNGNGGTLTAGNAIQTVDYGSSAIAPVYVKEGYTLSWDKSFNDVNEEIIVNAIWTIKTYIVTFDGNGGTLVDGETEQTIDYGNSAIAPVFEKEGYTLNWDKAFDHITENITIAAVWAIKTYTVTFDGNSGTYISGELTQTIEYGEGATSPVFTKEGYTLSWNKAFDNITADIIVTAIWTIETYSVTFDGDGGIYMSGELTQTVEYGNAATAPVFTKEGYTLSWNKAFDSVVGDLTVTAIWEIKTYTVTFDGNGGTLISGDEVQIVEHGDIAIAPIYEKEGYTLSWNKALNDIIEEVTITAIWTIKTYTVVFDGNGGAYVSGDLTQTIEHGKAAVAPVFAREKYILTWDKAFNNIICDINLIAIWRGEDYYTEGLAFSLNADGVSYSVSQGTASNEPEIIIPAVFEAKPVTTIIDSAFSGCNELKSIKIPKSVISIGYRAFEDCTSLTSITIPDSVTSIQAYTFLNCTSLISIMIGSGVTDIGSHAFYNCSSLISVDFPNEANIGWYAFANCSELVSANLPNCTTIGGKAFYGCNNLTNLTLPYVILGSGSLYFGNIFSNPQESSASNNSSVPLSLKSVTITGRAPISARAFDGCSGLTSITIGNDISSIGAYAFRNCSGLTSLTIGSSVTSIGESAFENCSSLTSITIPDGVPFIAESMFSGCSGLTSVTIGSGVTSIAQWAFSGCNELTGVYISDIAAWCGILFEGYASNPLIFASKLYVNGNLVTNLIIPAGVISISENAFNNCSELRNITIPDSVAFIGEGAFYRCNNIIYEIYGNAKYLNNWLMSAFNTNITTATLKPTTIGIYHSAFSGCSGLTSITIPNSVKSIGNSAFSRCSKLTSITIPDEVKSISHGLFSGCSGLTNITIPDSVTEIGQNAFSGCSNLVYEIYGNAKYLNNWLISAVDINISTVTLKSTTIGIYHNAFNGCSQLTAITIPDSLLFIGYQAFSGCSATILWADNPSITTIGDYAFSGYLGVSITIPGNVNYIGYNAFSGCNALTGVYISDIAAWCNISFVSYDSNPLYYAKKLYYNDNLVTDLVIPDGVSAIGSYAFNYCSELTSITLPDSVTSIGTLAFNYCNGLTGVYISDIAAWCNIFFNDEYSNPLYYARKLYLNGILVTTLDIPDGVTTIGSYAFQNCNELTSVNISNDVTSIGSRAFFNCNGLTSVTFSNKTSWFMTHMYDNWLTKTNGFQMNVTNDSTNVSYFTSYGYMGPYWFKV